MNIANHPQILNTTKKVLRTLLIIQIGLASLAVVRFVLFS